MSPNLIYSLGRKYRYRLRWKWFGKIVDENLRNLFTIFQPRPWIQECRGICIYARILSWLEPFRVNLDYTLCIKSWLVRAVLAWELSRSIIDETRYSELHRKILNVVFPNKWREKSKYLLCGSGLGWHLVLLLIWYLLYFVIVNWKFELGLVQLLLWINYLFGTHLEENSARKQQLSQGAFIMYSIKLF